MPRCLRRARVGGGIYATDVGALSLEASAITPKTWHHVAVSAGVDGLRQIFINASLLQSDYWDWDLAAAAPFDRGGSIVRRLLARQDWNMTCSTCIQYRQHRALWAGKAAAGTKCPGYLHGPLIHKRVCVQCCFDGLQVLVAHLANDHTHWRSEGGNVVCSRPDHGSQCGM